MFVLVFDTSFLLVACQRLDRSCLERRELGQKHGQMGELHGKSNQTQ